MSLGTWLFFWWIPPPTFPPYVGNPTALVNVAAISGNAASGTAIPVTPTADVS